MNLLDTVMPTVDAHCDIPCGIYETDTMRHAAETCQQMIDKIAELGEIDSPEKHNNFVRMIMIKEKHAQRVKHELYILWSDYFKPEHLERYPELHDTIWKAAKQASKVKQTLSADETQALLDVVQKVADIFAKTKAA